MLTLFFLSFPFFFFFLMQCSIANNSHHLSCPRGRGGGNKSANFLPNFLVCFLTLLHRLDSWQKGRESSDPHIKPTVYYLSKTPRTVKLAIHCKLSTLRMEIEGTFCISTLSQSEREESVKVGSKLARA